MKTFALCAAFLLLPFGASAQKAAARAPAGDKGLTDEMRDTLRKGRPLELVVLLEAESAKREILAAASPTARFELVRDYTHLPLLLVRFHSEESLRVVLEQPSVLAVRRTRTYRKLLNQSLPLISQPPVADSGKRGAGTTIAVLDSGVDYMRAAFGFCTAPGTPAGCKVVYAQDFAPDDFSRDSGDYHGTNVAGIVLGVAPETRIAALDVFTGESADSADIIEAVNWSIANQALYNIVAMNMSFGGGRYFAPCSDPVDEAVVAEARAAGILIVAASGNDAWGDSITSPACTPGVISVGAVYDANLGSRVWPTCFDPSSAADVVPCFSNSASFLTLLAPGASITAGGESFSGTSQAAPHVAGAVAVLRSAFPSDSLTETIEFLVGSGTNVVDRGSDLPKPRLNLLAAVSATPTWGCSPHAISLPGAADGTLLASSCHTTSSDSVYYVDVFRFAGTAGREVTIDLTSSQFDTYVVLRSPSGTEVASNDDAPGTTDSRLAYSLSESGSWDVLVESYAPYATGTYRLTLSTSSMPTALFSYAPLSPAVGRPIQFSDASTGLPAAWSWDFGDQTSSNVEDPSKTYSEAGEYTVRLTVSNSFGTSSSSQTVVVRDCVRCPRYVPPRHTGAP
jgi:subtilisin family serine protease